jgi:hypothetical protein
MNQSVQKPADRQEAQEAVRQFGLYRLVVNQAPPPAAFTVKKSRRDP